MPFLMSVYFTYFTVQCLCLYMLGYSKFQSILIGDDVVITVLALNGGQVRVGIA